MKRYLVLFLVFALTAGLFAGCSVLNEPIASTTPSSGTSITPNNSSKPDKEVDISGLPKFIVNAKNLHLIGYERGMTTFEIPSVFTNPEDNTEYVIVKIGPEAFRYHTELTSIYIPSTVREISFEAFMGCANLTTVSLEEGLDVIDNMAFYECVSLEHIDFPSSLRIIGDRAFGYCISLQEVSLPGNLEAYGVEYYTQTGKYKSLLGSPVFLGCAGLKRVILEDGFVKCASLEKLFSEDNNVDEIVLPKSIEVIKNLNRVYINKKTIYFTGSQEEFAEIVVEGIPLDNTNIIYNASIDFTPFESNVLSEYSDCLPFVITSITENPWLVYEIVKVNGENRVRITIPETFVDSDGNKRVVIGIARKAFPNLVDEVVLPKTLRFIGSEAFVSTKLQKINFPEKLWYVGDEAFSNCMFGSELILPNTVKYWGSGVFEWGHSALKSVVFEEGFTTIPYGMFSECSGLSSVTLPNSVSLIKGKAFSDTSLTEVYVPNPDAEINENAFNEGVQITRGATTES